MRRFVPLIVALSLLGSACSGDPERRQAGAERVARRERRGDRRRPTPAEKLGLVEGWGPTAAELERAAAHRRRDAAARPGRPGDRRRVAGHRTAGRDGAQPAPRRGHRLRRQRRVHPADPWRQCHARARRTPQVAAVPGRRPGGRHRRADQGRRDAVPDVHECRRGGRRAADDGTRRGPAAPSCAGSASTWCSPPTPTSPPVPAIPTIGSRSAGLGRRDGDRAGGRGGRRLHRRRAGPRAQALPGPRLGAAGQPPDAAGADPHPQAADGRSTSLPSRPPSSRACRRSWPATSTSGPSTRGCRRRCRRSSSPTCSAPSSASTGSSSPTRSRWPGCRRRTTRRARPCRACAPATTSC